MSKKTTAPTLEDRLTTGVDQAALWAAPKVEAALAWAERGLGEGKVRGKAARAQASHQVADTIERLTPPVKAGLGQAGAALAGAAERVAPVVETARHKVQDEYVPAASGRLAGVAGQASRAAHHAKVSPAVESALIGLTGDKKAVKKLRRAAEQYAKSAERQLKKQARKSGSGNTGWLVAGMVVAAGAAAVAVWQLTKPVDDPWKAPAPAPLPRTGAPAGATVPAAAATTGADPDLATRAPSTPAATPASTATTTLPAATPGAGTTPAPAVAAGDAVVDTAEEKVEGVPAPKSAE
ncbi:hypothetical protein E7744_00050 [Citricoccus sp. SGAir0253]|uniref:hypothetical protein n=1 Tax=Citricoccus sp. SGAir0253 TaxID=2567881 RepID=UPI0010CD3D0B|nr:hypothetical protein [Citricoccus sp. SGAir0253]QCU76809.1 hypothetical protein E7744_00050 [Citricoccus sp. SGAir0253]